MANTKDNDIKVKPKEEAKKQPSKVNNAPIKKDKKEKEKPSKVEKKKRASKARNIVKKVFKTEKKEAKPKAFEEKPDLEKLYLYIVIVNAGVGRTVEKLMQNLGSSMQFTHVGRGTAPKEILNIMGIADNSKAIVNAVIGQDKLSTVKEELEIFFAASKKNRGVAFAVPFSAVKGVRMYKYLTQTI